MIYWIITDVNTCESSYNLLRGTGAILLMEIHVKWIIGMRWRCEQVDLDMKWLTGGLWNDLLVSLTFGCSLCDSDQI
jgi:hypothetical protein